MKKAMLAITANQMSYDQGVIFIEGVNFSLNQIFLNISKATVNKGMNEAISLASEMFRVPISELKGRCRLREVVDARVVFCWHMMDEGLRDEEIAVFLRKDRTTMIHFRKKKEDLIQFVAGNKKFSTYKFLICVKYSQIIWKYSTFRL